VTAPWAIPGDIPIGVSVTGIKPVRPNERGMSTDRPERAVACLDAGFSCAQAICQVCGPEFGLSRDTASRIAAGLGAGMARTDDICGAVSGAVLVLGLAYGGNLEDAVPARERTYAAVQKFIAAFTAAQGSVSCTGLLGYNLGDLDEFAAARQAGIVRRVCPAMVRAASELLEEMPGQPGE